MPLTTGEFPFFFCLYHLQKRLSSHVSCLFSSLPVVRWHPHDLEVGLDSSSTSRLGSLVLKRGGKGAGGGKVVRGRWPLTLLTAGQSSESVGTLLLSPSAGFALVVVTGRSSPSRGRLGLQCQARSPGDGCEEQLLPFPGGDQTLLVTPAPQAHTLQGRGAGDSNPMSDTKTLTEESDGLTGWRSSEILAWYVGVQPTRAQVNV